MRTKEQKHVYGEFLFSVYIFANFFRRERIWIFYSRVAVIHY